MSFILFLRFKNNQNMNFQFNEQLFSGHLSIVNIFFNEGVTKIIRYGNSVVLPASM